MRVSDNKATVEVHDDEELTAFLARRYQMDGAHVNSFWMSHAEEWPALGILARDDLACLDYMADSEGTAFTSQGEVPGLTKGGITEFRLDTQRQPVLNSKVVRFADAVRAAAEFLHAKELPGAVKWLRL